MKVYIFAFQAQRKVSGGTDVHFSTGATVASSKAEADGIALKEARDSFSSEEGFFDYRVVSGELDKRIIEWIKAND